jgi:hypothetical protein
MRGLGTSVKKCPNKEDFQVFKKNSFIKKFKKSFKSVLKTKKV